MADACPPFCLEIKMKKYKSYQKVLICIFPFALAFFLFLAAEFALNCLNLPGCLTYEAFGINCPGCGLTRSVAALLNGDILLSLRQNPILIFSILAFAVFYLEFALRSFGLNIRFPIHSTRLLYAVLIIWGVYSVLRNFIPCLAPI